jgi:hypothetical protein
VSKCPRKCDNAVFILLIPVGMNSDFNNIKMLQVAMILYSWTSSDVVWSGTLPLG